MHMWILVDDNEKQQEDVDDVADVIADADEWMRMRRRMRMWIYTDDNHKEKADDFATLYDVYYVL